MAGRILRDDASQVGDRGLRVQTRQHMIAARVTGELEHARVPVVEVAEYDRLRRTGRLARGDDVAVAHVAVLESRLVLGAADALHAEGAFLHHALLAHRHVGVEQHRQRLGERFVLPVGLRVVVPVEVADLVRTVVGAVARADAAVIDLAVQPVRRVIGGEHRTDRLARRVAALLAEHRGVDRALRLAVLVGEPIALEPHPRHLAATLHQLLADRRDVVLGVAGGHARGAAGALRQIDREPPARLLAFVVADLRFLVLALRPPFDGLGGVCGRLLVMERRIAGMQGFCARETEHLDGPAAALAGTAFGRDDLAVLAGLRRGGAYDEGAAAVRGRLGTEQLERVGRTVLGIAAVRGVALPRRHGHTAYSRYAKDRSANAFELLGA